MKKQAKIPELTEAQVKQLYVDPEEYPVYKVSKKCLEDNKLEGKPPTWNPWDYYPM